MFAVPALLCCAWTIFAGKDLNWDLLHYHLYVPYAFLGGRMAQDYFAASAQSYQNPLAFLPFYGAVFSGVPSVVVSALFAAFHGANLALLYLVARRLVEERLSAVLAAAIGGASAVFWAMTGTSFIDPLLTVPMLAALLLLVSPRARPGWAGALFGVAAALKYSNAFFALAAIVLVRSRRGFAAYALGGAAAVALLAGPWIAVLYREFGNPVFPHLNSFFRSPDFPPISLGAERFAPHDLFEALSFPFRMASPEFMTYVEISAPDLRFAALALAAAALAGRIVIRRSPATALTELDKRFLIFFLLALAAWIATSANGRYGLLVLLLVGPCIARVAELAGGTRPARVVLPVVLVAQITACALISPPRWFVYERWTRQWLPFAVPERGRNEPALYLVLETQSMMSVAPFLNPGSSFVNLRGQHSLAPGWQRVERLVAQHEGHVRTLGRGLRLQSDGKPRPEVVGLYDSTMLRFGFRVDADDCYPIAWEGDETDAASRLANSLAPYLETRARLMSLASCALVRAERDPADIAAEARISAIFDRIERGCPRLFRGHTATTDPLGEEWSRTYAGLEARLETRAGRVVLAPFFKLGYYDLGMIADWERGAAPRPPACAE